MITRALEDSEIKAIFEHVSGTNAKRNETLLIAGIGMALRASELVGLQVGDVYDGAGGLRRHGTAKQVKTYVTIRAETAKFNKERIIRIGDGIQNTIADFIEWKVSKGESIDHNTALFVSQKSGHLTRQALFEIVKKIFNNASIDQSPHCLRKTGATIYYIESDYDLIATQQFLGHADPSTTRRYIGLTSEQIVEYAERMSDHLFAAIHAGKVGEFDTMLQMSHLTVQDAIRFLNQQGFEVKLTMKEEREPKKIVASAGVESHGFAEAKPVCSIRRDGTASKVIALPRKDKKADTK